MSTLAAYAAFLTARWDEIEAVARAASTAPWAAVPFHSDRSLVVNGFNIDDGVIVATPRKDDADVEHIALHDPRYALADIAAKRAILAVVERPHAMYPGAAHELVTLLAEPFRSHPDHPANQEQP